MKTYIVETGAAWFCVKTKNLRKAYSEGIKTFGRGSFPMVHPASKEDEKYYLTLKGRNAIVENS